jgi:hypothetical protein
MDLERQEIVNLEELKADHATQAVANAVAAETGQAEWNKLRHIYWGLKQYWTEHADLDRTEVCFPPENGTMVGYFEIFPYAKRLEFIHEQETWLIDDQYCCNPNCSCKEALLSFIRIPEKTGQGATQPTLSIFYEYRNGKIRPLEAEENPQLSGQGLVASLTKAHADLDSLLAKRQSLLRRLYGRILKRQTIQSPAPKIGRNEPCPCGSGKKYKRCCGA